MRKLLLHQRTVQRSYVDPITHMGTAIYKVPFDTDSMVADVYEFMRAAEKALYLHYTAKYKKYNITLRATDFWPGAILVHLSISLRK